MTDIVKHLRMNAEDFRYDNADDYASHGVLMLDAAKRLEAAEALLDEALGYAGERLAEKIHAYFRSET